MQTLTMVTELKQEVHVVVSKLYDVQLSWLTIRWEYSGFILLMKMRKIGVTFKVPKHHQLSPLLTRNTSVALLR